MHYVLAQMQLHLYVVFSSRFVENLKKLPAPEVAVKYYTGGDLYLFGKFCQLLIFVSASWKAILGLNIPQIYFSSDEFQTDRAPNSRRPKIGKFETLILLWQFIDQLHARSLNFY